MDSIVTCLLAGSTRTRIIDWVNGDLFFPSSSDPSSRTVNGAPGAAAGVGVALAPGLRVGGPERGRHDGRRGGLSYAGNDDREEVGGGARRPGQQEAEQSQHRYTHRMQTGGTPTPCGPLTSHQLERIMRYSRLKFDERDPGRALPLDSVNGLNHTKGYGFGGLG